MVIKNRDGTVFKLKGPNPLMKSQEIWDKHSIKLINFNNKELFVEIDSKNPIKEFEEDIPDITKAMEKVVKNIEAVTVEEPKVEEQIEEKVFSNDFLKLYDKKKISFLGVETFDKLYKDDLYGDSYSKTEFSERINFHGVIIDQNDFNLSFWSMQKINLKSVVYPKNETKRWWQVQSCSPISGGFKHVCVTSTLNPDFT